MVTSDSVLERRLANLNRTKNYQGPIDYMGTKISYWHYPLWFIDDIIGENETKQFTSILIIGSPGTGKTTLANFIAHNIHMKQDYIVVHLRREELLRFDTLIDDLPNRNVILIFDDVSLVFKHIKDPSKRTRILTTLTEARHPKFENSDRRVIVIANIHYVNAIEKMWRSQGGWKFYTDLSNEEIQNFNYMTKSKFKKKVQNFANITTEQFRKKHFTVSFVGSKTKTFDINKPFRFVMCYDNSALRFFLVPAESCNYCSKDKNKLAKVKATPQEIIKLAEKYYKKDGRAGLKLALLLAGFTAQYRNNTIYAFNMAREILQSFDIDLEALALVLREQAQIKDPRLYTIRSKRTNFLEDLEKIRQEAKDTEQNKDGVYVTTPTQEPEEDQDEEGEKLTDEELNKQLEESLAEITGITEPKNESDETL